ncbi:Hypothetical protein CINCED_3A000032 [Cinara cedri]|uniref:Uncharacterized protein n=1 Tax=Cinara cedri TaxID=506608 RepID=A0A5E4MRZ8_9HEMI|nr:Hypothetical protein CINCED_3A000032 [Cinara cedri]
MGILKSVPYMSVTSRILDKSDDSMASFKSCVTDTEREIENSRPSVKALIEKHKSFQNQIMNAKETNFDVKNKSFANACENLNTSYNDCCRNMEGDTQRVDKVENVVKNHVFGVLNVKMYEGNDTEKSAQVPDHKSVSENFDFKTGTLELDETVNGEGEQMWQNIRSLVNINHDYYRCLTDILDTNKFNNLDSIKDHVGSVLKQGKKAESVEPDLIAYCHTNLEKNRQVTDNQHELNNDSITNDPFLIYHSKLSALQNELTESKKSKKIAEGKIASLERKNRDLLNILNSYENENVHRVSLERHLKAEQKNNEKLRDMITKDFKQKIPSYNIFS